MTIQQALQRIDDLQVEQAQLLLTVKAMIGGQPVPVGSSGQMTKRAPRITTPGQIKTKIEQLLISGATVPEVQEATGKSSSTVERIKRRLREAGKLKGK